MSAEAADVSASIAQAPSGGSAPVSGSSTHERLRSFLGGSEPAAADSAQPKAAEPVEAQAPAGDSLASVDPVPVEADQGQAEVDGVSGDAQTEDWQPSKLSDLREALSWDEDKFLSLPVSVKIDGKEGTATLRDLIKSYQLDGHINQKLASVDTDRKALMADREKFNSERADKLLKLDAGLKTLERVLLNEFQSVDWQKLAAESPNDYNSKFVAFQQRNAELQDIAGQIAQEQQQFQAQQLEAQKAWLEEQRSMLQAKVPEWADESTRAKDKADILKYLDGYGITKDEFESLADHRFALVVRDAWKWGALQKSKPAVLNKVRTAPKLLKPGSQQSKDASNAIAIRQDQARLKQTGRISDAAKLLKGRMFG